MEDVVELFTSILKNGSFESLNLFLNSSYEQKVFRQKNELEVVAFINGLLNDPSTRDRGLLILKVYLSQSTKSSISSHLVFWSKICLGACHSGNPIAFSLLGSLFEITVSTDLKKQIAQDFIPKFLEFVLISLKDNKQPLIPLLRCFNKCLECYGKSCVPYKEALQDELLKLLSKDEAVVNLMGKSFLLLICAGAPGIDNINYANEWKKKYLVIINTMHKLTDYLFSELKEIKNSFEKTTLEKETLNIPCIKEKSAMVKVQKFTQQFCGLCRILETFLIGGFPAKKVILPEALLGIIWRILSVSYDSLKDYVSLEGFTLKSQLPNLHSASLKVLNSFMLCVRSNLLPYASVISKLLVQMLKITPSSGHFYGQEKSLTNVRGTAYACLLTWLNITRSGCALTSHSSVIIESICCDVLYKKPAVVLNVEAKPKGKLKKKKTKNYVPSTSVQLDYQIDSTANSKLCQAALNIVPSLMRAISPSISAPLHKKLQEVIVKACFEIKRSNGGPDLLIPYGVAECRVSLYKALLALCMCPHPVFPPPLHYAKFILTSALDDSSDKVVELCNGALCSLKHIMSPSLPTFNFPVNLSAEIVPINPTLHSPINESFDYQKSNECSSKLTLKVDKTDVKPMSKFLSPETAVRTLLSPDEMVTETIELDKVPTEEEIGDLETVKESTKNGETHTQENTDDPGKIPPDEETIDLEEALDPDETIDLEETPARENLSDNCIDLADSSSNESIVLIEKTKNNHNGNDQDDCYITDLSPGNEKKKKSSQPSITECDVIITSENSYRNGRDESFVNHSDIDNKGNNSPLRRSKRINAPLVEDLTNDNSSDVQFDIVDEGNLNVNSKRKSILNNNRNHDVNKKQKTDSTVEDNTCIIDDEVEEAMLGSFVDIVPES